MRRSILVAVTLALSALGAAACDRPPSADGAREWTPSDHDGEKSAGASGKQGARGESGSGAPALVEITWRNQCASCHGIGGKGDGPQGAMFKPPDLTQSKSDDATLVSTIKNGKGRMPKFELSDEVVQGLAARVKSFRGQ